MTVGNYEGVIKVLSGHAVSENSTPLDITIIVSLTLNFVTIGFSNVQKR